MKSIRRTYFLPGMILAAAVLAGCEDGGHSRQSGAPIQGTPDAAVEYLAVSEAGAVEHKEGRLLELVNRGDQTLVLVDFGATWCGPCQMLSPSLSKIKKSWGDKIEIVKVDVDTCRDVTAHLGVNAVPDVRIYRNGTQVGGFTGLMPREDIESLLKSLQ